MDFFIYNLVLRVDFIQLCGTILISQLCVIGDVKKNRKIKLVVNSKSKMKIGMLREVSWSEDIKIYLFVDVWYSRLGMFCIYVNMELSFCSYLNFQLFI